MSKKLSNRTLAARVDQLATKRQVQALARVSAANFEQLVVSLNAALRLMEKGIRRNARKTKPRRVRA